MATTFSEAMERAPLRAFQIATFAICMLVLTCDGIDQQLLGIIAPKVIADFGVAKSTFGIAMSASLVGFGLGAWSGGWLGDAVGRRWSLAIAAAVFALATAGASLADGVWSLAVWRVVGGLGFGSAYSNAMAMTGEWLPGRWRSVAVTTLSVGTPAGGTVVGWLAPDLVTNYGWRGAFIAFGLATLLIVVLIVAALRDSPSFLLVRGKPAEARRAAAKLLGSEVDLQPETHATDVLGGSPIGVLHRSNLRLNIGIGITFAACALCAYGVLNWSTTFLTAKGFTLAQAGNAVSIGGLTSIVSSIAAGLLVHRFGSKAVMAAISATLVVSFIVLAITVERLPVAPSADDRLLVVVMVGITAAIFSAGMASMYALMTYGYPQSCRSAGIGFGIFVARVGAISASGLGGWLLDLGHGSTVPYFAVLTVSAALIMAAPLIVDRHVPPARRARTALA
uniref:MFS transporter n=1 Tax=Altererythrobacter segetis TaxID=1104773 RepID=UPI00140B3EF9|nr:MFS transporter [Altererythrobacter segetis]